MATVVGDQSSLLQNSGSNRYARSPGSQHVRKKLLRERHSISLEPILAHQEPAGEPLVHFMQPVTSRYVDRLHSQVQAVAAQFFCQRRASGEKFQKIPGVDAVRGAPYLHNDARSTGGESHEKWKADKPFLASEPDFNAFPVYHHGEDRSEPTFNKVCELDRFARFMQFEVCWQLDKFQVLQYRVAFLCRQTQQNQVSKFLSAGFRKGP